MQARMLAWGAWLLLLMGVIADTAIEPERTVVPTYREAVIAWWSGAPLYQADGMGFLYLPQACIVFAPLAWVPSGVAEVGWRAVNVVMLAWALSRLCAQAGRSPSVSLFPHATIVVIPLAVAGARNGQCTLLMTAIMLLAVTDLAERRWSRATCWLALGVAVKPLAIVLALLAFALFRTLRWRLILAALMVAFVPFLTQRPAYVWDQFEACRQMLIIASERGQEAIWAQPFTVLKLCGIDVSPQIASAVRIAGAVFVLVLGWLVRRRQAAPEAAANLYTLTALYLLLFNPRTENNTYVLLAPSLGLCYAQARCVEKDWRTAMFMGLLAIGILASFELGRLVTPPPQSVWLAPVMATGYFIFVAIRITSPGLRIGKRRVCPEGIY